MKAIAQETYGPFEDVLRLVDVPIPTPGSGQVLVRVKAASVHADVWHAVTGRPWSVRLFGMGLIKPKYPIPGTDLSGIIEALGPDVNDFSIGDEVFGESHNRLQWTHGGAFAEYAAVPASTLARKPQRVSFEEAACVPSSGYIALSNLREGKPKPGHHVLINGAGGGVGSLALQMAKAMGTQVTAVDCQDKLDMLRELGADHTIDYQMEDFTQGKERFDIILDVASTLTLSNCTSALSPEGKYVRIGHEHYGQRGGITGSLPGFFLFMAMAPFRRQLPELSFDIPKKADIMFELAQLLETGQLTPKVDRIFPLEHAALALRYLEEGRARGKILLVPS